jgi:hypothetical protein
MTDGEEDGTDLRASDATSCPVRKAFANLAAE